MDGPLLSAQREHVAQTARALAADGLVLGSAGNVSERDRDLVAVTPTGAALGELDAGDVVVVDTHGRLVQGEHEPTSELVLHLGAYRRYDSGAVVHAHPPFGTALSCVLHELPAVHYQMLALGGPVRVAPYATFGTPELAELTLEALEGRSAALMSNHGAIALGEDAFAALERARLLEWACALYWRAASIGTPRTLNAEQLRAVAETAAQRRYRLG